MFKRKLLSYVAAVALLIAGASNAEAQLDYGQTLPVPIPSGGNGTIAAILQQSAVSQQNQVTANVNVLVANLQGIFILQDWTCIVQGAGSVVGNGHVPCTQAEAYSSISALPLLNPMESVVGTLPGVGTVSNAANNILKANFVAGGTVSNWFGVYNLTANTGTVTVGAVVYCQPWTGTPPGQNFCIYNVDPTMAISNAGQFQNSGRMLENGTTVPAGFGSYFEIEGLVATLPTMAASSAAAFVSAANGVVLAGNGTSCDATLANDAGAAAVCILHGTQGVNFPVVPTSAGGGGLYLCADSTGTIYKKSACP